jgi:cell fate (sporulation/competence/biofilm development) regulator YlbF (YheA/YmcA/DUF963 family)
MESNEIIKKIAASCNVLNSILRDEEKYHKLKERYKELERSGKIQENR